MARLFLIYIPASSIQSCCSLVSEFRVHNWANTFEGVQIPSKKTVRQKLGCIAIPWVHFMIIDATFVSIPLSSRMKC